MQTRGKIAVAGATGRVGHHVVDVLEAQGEAATTRQIELSAGTIEYEDTGGKGPVIVLLHGLLMDSSLWDAVIADLAGDHRCIAPTLPPGGALVQLVVRDDAARVGRIVLASSDAFDNYPPGLTGKALVLSGKLPPALFGLFMQQLRLKPVRRLPIAFGWLTKRGDAATRRWLTPILEQSDIRRDAVRTLHSISAEPDLMLRAADCLPSFDRPALVVWAREDKVMPPEHGRRLAALLPQGRLVHISDSYTLIPLDQPAERAYVIQAFVLLQITTVGGV